MTEEINIQIERVLDKIRPFLNRDGGDVELYGFKDGVVYLKMAGACEGCIMASDDITAGVEIILTQEVPGVIGVDASGNVPQDVMDEYNARQAAKAKDDATKDAVSSTEEPKDDSK